jgi:hypothetical protein
MPTLTPVSESVILSPVWLVAPAPASRLLGCAIGQTPARSGAKDIKDSCATEHHANSSKPCPLVMLLHLNHIGSGISPKSACFLL